MPDRARLRRAQVANVLALVLIVALAGALIVTEAARQRQARETKEYRQLWADQRRAVNRCVGQRMAGLEERVATIPKKEANVVYQARLADVRQRFARVVRGTDAPACPAASPVPVPTAEPAVRPDEPACPFTEEEAVTARATAQQLAALQAWVRENMGEVK